MQTHQCTGHMVHLTLMWHSLCLLVQRLQMACLLCPSATLEGRARRSRQVAVLPDDA